MALRNSPSRCSVFTAALAAAACLAPIAPAQDHIPKVEDIFRSLNSSSVRRSSFRISTVDGLPGKLIWQHIQGMTRLRTGRYAFVHDKCNGLGETFSWLFVDDGTRTRRYEVLRNISQHPSGLTRVEDFLGFRNGKCTVGKSDRDNSVRFHTLSGLPLGGFANQVHGTKIHSLQERAPAACRAWATTTRSRLDRKPIRRSSTGVVEPFLTPFPM